MTEISKERILDKVNDPEDIRKLDLNSLTVLAEEIREMIIETVSRSGGHLASSLGTVELTLAIHYVFDTPRDKLIWDVGHQAYTHKIITGRKDRFHTLRQKGGLSGFPRKEESPYDVFNSGHSGTSISAAAGLAESRCLLNENHRVIAVIGDGSMTAGMAFEGLNWAGDRKKGLIIILNDNEMSISANVGALSSYLNRLMTGQTVTKLKAEVKSFLKTIPSIGEGMVRVTRQIEESLKSLIVPGALFEELGFTYVGPLEGHRLDHLIKTLENIKKLQRPVLVHIVTKKGKGYRPAEAEPLRFHGVAPFEVNTGLPLSAGETTLPPSYTEMFGRTIAKLARENSRIVTITAAMGNGTGLDAFAKEFPERFYDVGIAEQHGVTFAAGLATASFIPVVAIYSTFMQRAYDQVIHDVCLQNLPVVLAMDRGGFVGDDGPTHHGLFDFSYLRSIPNLIVMAPKDENELQHMLKTAVEAGRPASLRYPRGRGLGVPIDAEPQRLDIGKGEILRVGPDLAIVAIGSTVHPALTAAQILIEGGIDATVINARFVKPLDRPLLCEAASRFKRMIVVEENVLMGGFGSAVLELFEEAGIADVKIRRLGIKDQFMEHATQAQLRKMSGIDSEGIAEAARHMMEGNAGPAGG
ncbi:MAG: 1-deoxy-D-xylulose-5-phosphate synthase [Deltaproteobacteria bacterium]|nr:1-deoxy-D-xylulose-5-phosphate synthase [Deltaproteobacteria bacterium]